MVRGRKASTALATQDTIHSIPDEGGMPWTQPGQGGGRWLVAGTPVDEPYPCGCDDEDPDPPVWKKEQAQRTRAPILLCNPYIAKKGPNAGRTMNRCRCWGRPVDGTEEPHCCRTHPQNPAHAPAWKPAPPAPTYITGPAPLADSLDDDEPASVHAMIGDDGSVHYVPVATAEAVLSDRPLPPLAAMLAAPTTVRVLVTGSRTWDDVDAIEAELDKLYFLHGDNLVVVHGACPDGADAIADAWCVRTGVEVERHPVNWSLGKGAGPARNQVMVDAGAELCLAFIRDGSRGATHCASRAEAAGIRTVIRRPEDRPVEAKRRWSKQELHCTCLVPEADNKRSSIVHCCSCHQNFLNESRARMHQQWWTDPCKRPEEIRDCDTGAPLLTPRLVGRFTVWA